LSLFTKLPMRYLLRNWACVVGCPRKLEGMREPGL
jgi:hypothetical protein